MSASGSPTRSVRVRWTGTGEVFRGRGASPADTLLDGEGGEGPSPTETLLLSLGACMGIDVRMILEKGRVPLESLEVELDGDRRPEPPRYFTRIRMVFRLEGPTEDARPKVDRAVRLSREKYCSVLHTLREDLEFEVEIHLS